MEIKYTFEEYQTDIELYKKTSPYESSYQRVIEDTIRDITRFLKLELIISDKFRRKSTAIHSVIGYKEEETASPDLMGTKNFLYHNKDENEELIKNNTTYYAYIEVKIPGEIKFFTDEEQEIIDYTEHDKNQIKTYLAHQNGKKVIFTDTYTWAFYDGNFDDPKIIKLKENEIWDAKGTEWGRLHKTLEEFIRGSH